jgi:hypothetical protein
MFNGARQQALQRFNSRFGGPAGGVNQGNVNQGGFSQPGSGQPGGGQGGFGQAGSGQAGSGQAGSGQTGFAQVEFGQPGSSQPGSSQPGSSQAGAPAQNWPPSGADDDYDHYNVEGSGQGPQRSQGYRRGARDVDLDFAGDNPIDDIGGALFSVALGFAGRAIGRRMKKAFEEKVIPVMQERAAQAQQQSAQSQADADAIVERYPELRGCLKDQVIFLDGGYRTVPVSDLQLPITLAQADAVVARLR